MREIIYQFILIVSFLVLQGSAVVMEANALYTTFSVYYPDANLDSQKIYIRGDNCNFTWNKGLVLNHTSANLWQTAMLCHEGVNISVKALLNDTNWMFGGNKIFIGGQSKV